LHVALVACASASVLLRTYVFLHRAHDQGMAPTGPGWGYSFARALDTAALDSARVTCAASSLPSVLVSRCCRRCSCSLASFAAAAVNPFSDMLLA
jgi:hypothetical protein